MGFINIDTFDADAQRAVDDFNKECLAEVKNAARVVTDEMMARTPVWSGKTVRNYAWGVGGPGGGYTEPSNGGVGPRHPSGRGAHPSPSLGEEPNRAENEDAAKQEMEGVLGGISDFMQMSPLVLTNHSPIWDLVDNGSAPTPERARNPGGVSILAEQAAKGKLENFK